MSYSITCPCGTTIPLKLTQAGSVVACACGRENQVPPMSQLRQAAGQTPRPLSIVEQIEQKIERGELPEGQLCVFSGVPTEEIHYFHIQCERPWFASGAVDYLMAFLNGLVLMSVGKFDQGGQEIRGRDISLTVPLRIDSERSGSLARYNQRKLRDLLSHEPSYQQLLQEYPEAVISPRYSTPENSSRE